MKLCKLIFQLYLVQNFFHRHTDRWTDWQTGKYFLKIANWCLKHAKTRISSKNRKLKIFTKSILSSIYIKESKILINGSFIIIFTSLVFCYFFIDALFHDSPSPPVFSVNRIGWHLSCDILFSHNVMYWIVYWSDIPHTIFVQSIEHLFCSS